MVYRIKPLIIIGLAAISTAMATEYPAGSLLRHGGVANVHVVGRPPEIFLNDIVENLEYEVLDIERRVVAAGKADRSAPRLQLPTLETGYYRVKLTVPNHTVRGEADFCIIPEPGPGNPDLFYAVDAAQSWLAAGADGGNRFAEAAKLAQLAGINCVRERLSWAGTETERGKYDFTHYRKSADTLAAEGVQILDMFHDSPAWSRERSPLLPDDLLALHDFARKAAEEFGSRVQYWEFWNEQDLLNSVSESAWDYAACLKAAAAGFRRGNPDIKVLNGGYSLLPLIRFDRVVAENDTLQLLDIFNFHTYKGLELYPQLVTDIRRMLAEFGRPDMPVWITENGTNVEGNGEAEGIDPAFKAHSPQQELLHAEFVTKSHITLQSLGIDRNFTFVLLPYNERNGGKDWGLIRRDFTVKPAYSALAALIAQLGNAVYRGSLAGDIPENLRTFVYEQPDGSQTLVAWLPDEIDGEAFRGSGHLRTELRIPGLETAHTVDMWGRELKCIPGAVTDVGNQPVFFHGLRNLPLQAVPEKKTDSRPDRKTTDDDMVVFKAIHGGEFTLSYGRDMLLLNAPSGTFTLQIWNFDDREKHGTVSVANGSLDGIPGEITLPPRGKVEIPCVYTPGETHPDRDLTRRLTITGNFDGRNVSRLVVPIRTMTDLGDYLNAAPIPGVLDPANWVNRSSGDLTITRQGELLDLKVDYPPNVDRWVYPEIGRELVATNNHAVGISFEIRATSPEYAVSDVYAMIQDPEGAQWISFPMPQKEWNKAVIIFEQPLSPEVTGIAIGMNPRSDHYSYQLRNIEWLHLKQQ